MIQISPINFGLIIAYFLPGILSLYSLSYISEHISNLFQAAQSVPINIGAIFFLVTAALVVGLIVSSLRVSLLEPLHYKTGVTKPTIDYHKLETTDKLSLFKEIVENVYRYHQFYGNIMLALLLLLITRYLIAKSPIFDSAKTFTLFFVNSAGIVFLFIASRKTLKDVCKAIGDICT